MNFFFLIFFLFLHANHSAANESEVIKVAIVDTSFCHGIKTSKNITVGPVFDATLEKFGKESEACKQKNKFDSSIHGHFVLQNFLKHVKSNKNIQIYPIKVYGQADGLYRFTSLEKLLPHVKNLSPTITLMCVGHQLREYRDLQDFNLPGIVISASGTRNINLPDSTILWPQNFDLKNQILVAHFFKSKMETSDTMVIRGHYDTATLNFKKINYWVPSPPDDEILKGSSYAASAFAGALIGQCYEKNTHLNIKDLLNCMDKFSKKLELSGSPNKERKYYKSYVIE